MGFPLFIPGKKKVQQLSVKTLLTTTTSIVLCLVTALFPGKAVALEAVVMHNVFFSPTEGAKPVLKPYIELYWQINPQTVFFKQENELWQGKIRTDITIRNESGAVKEEHFILETLPVSDRNQILNQKIIDLRRYNLPFGKFTLEVKFTDVLKTGNEFAFTDSFEVEAPADRPLVSDIQLVDTAFASKEENIFQRNNKIQIPLSTNFLDDTRKVVKYYAELYNLNSVNKELQPLTSKVFISKKEFERNYSTVTKTDTILPALLQIAEGSISTSSFASGNYYLNIVIEDKSKNPIAAKSLFFQLLNTNPTDAPVVKNTTDSAIDAPVYLDLNKTFLAKYNFAQVRAILKMLLPIAEPNEKSRINEFIKVPDEMYSRYFVYNFWLTRNKLNPEEEWKQYSEKVKEVNKLFGSSMLPGYETERGGIYLKYGKPTNRVVVENEEGSLPYEVWQYNSLPRTTNAILLFYRPGFISNDYRLLHTTINGEVRNRNWRAELYSSNGGGTRRNNSRAEQFIGDK